MPPGSEVFANTTLRSQLRLAQLISSIFPKKQTRNELGYLPAATSQSSSAHSCGLPSGSQSTAAEACQAASARLASMPAASKAKEAPKPKRTRKTGKAAEVPETQAEEILLEVEPASSEAASSSSRGKETTPAYELKAPSEQEKGHALPQASCPGGPGEAQQLHFGG